MTKMQFLMALHDALSGLPRDEIEERLNFYTEMIEDRMEEGFSEEDAVAAVGSVTDIANQILGEIPLMKLAKEKIKPKRPMKAWEIVLLAVGFPIWGSLLIAVLSVAVSVYAALWSIVIALWAVFGALVGVGVGGTVAGIAWMIGGQGAIGLAVTGAALVCAGLGIFLFFGCKYATIGTAKLAKLMVLGVKKSMTRKEAA